MQTKQIVCSNIEQYTQEITKAVEEGWQVCYGYRAPMLVGFSMTAWLERDLPEDSVEIVAPTKPSVGRPPKQK